MNIIIPGRERAVGLDVGTGAIKALMVGRRRSGPVILGCGVVPVDPTADSAQISQAIDELMRLEGAEEPDAGTVTAFPLAPEPGTSSIASAVYDYLQDRGVPTHYSELTREVVLRGVAIGGKSPSNTLLAHLSRDDRFYRPSRGTYALKEWNPNARSVGVRRKKGA